MKPMRSLSPDEYVLLLALQADPTASFKELGLVCGFNPRRAKQLYDTLKKDNIVRGAFVKTNDAALGLARYDVLVECTNFSQVEAIHRLAKAHPYTQFFTRYYSCNSGVFLQFAIPQGTAPLMDKLFNTVISEGYASSFEPFSALAPHTIATLTNVEAWNPVSFEWDFHFGDFQEKFESFREANTRENMADTVFPPVTHSHLSELTMFDIILIREMTMDITRSQAQITQDIIKHDAPTPRDQSTYPADVRSQTNTSRVSRRRKFLEDNHIIRPPMLYYNSSYLNLFNDWLVVSRCSQEFAETFFSFFCPETPSNDPSPQYISRIFPFSSRITYYHESDYFSWYVRIPPKETSAFHRFVISLFDNPYIVSLDSDIHTTYWFYHENFNSLTHSWKESKEWLVDASLKAVRGK